MADIKKKYIDTERQFGGVPYGNRTDLEFVLATTAGVADNSDTATAIQVGDIVKIGLLPAGFRILDALTIISAAFTATSTAKIGFQYADGVDDADVPEDDDYFAAALAIATAGRAGIANTASAPVELPKDAYMIVTNAVAIQAATSKLTVVVEGILRGDK